MCNKVKVLYISHEGDSYGGATKSLLNLLSSVDNNICPIVIVPKTGKAYDFFIERNIQVFPVTFNVNITAKKGIFRLITYIPKLVINFFINKRAINTIVRYAKQENFEYVHSNSSVIDIGLKVAKKINAKHIWHLREFQNLDFGFNPVIGWHLYLKKINKSDIIICVSNAIKKHYGLDNNSNVHVIYNAIKSKNNIVQLSDYKKENYILFVGNVIKQKG